MSDDSRGDASDQNERRPAAPCGAAAAAKAPSSEREVPEVSGDVWTAKPSRPTTPAPGSLASPPRPLAGSARLVGGLEELAERRRPGALGERGGEGGEELGEVLANNPRALLQKRRLERARKVERARQRRDADAERDRPQPRHSPLERAELGPPRARCQLAPRSPTCRWYTPKRDDASAPTLAPMTATETLDAGRIATDSALNSSAACWIAPRSCMKTAFSPRTLISPLSSAAAGLTRPDATSSSAPSSDVIVQSAAVASSPAASRVTEPVDDGAARSSQSPPAPRQKRTATARVSSGGRGARRERAVEAGEEAAISSRRPPCALRTCWRIARRSAEQGSAGGTAVCAGAALRRRSHVRARACDKF